MPSAPHRRETVVTFALFLLLLGVQTANGASSTPACTVADRLQALDDFRAALSPADRARLDRALPRDGDGGIRQCDGVDTSRAACEAAAYRPALRRTGLMKRLTAGLCAGPATGPSSPKR